MKLTKYTVYKDEMGQTVSFSEAPPLANDSNAGQRFEISVNDGVVGYGYGEPDERLAAQMLILYGDEEDGS